MFEAMHDQAEDSLGLGARLPPDTLTRILKAVDQHDRIGSCASVCTSWHAAALAATSSIILKVSGQQQLPAKFQALIAWLSSHGTGVEGLELTARDLGGNSLQLPYSSLKQLRQLNLSNTHVSVAAASAVSQRLSSPNNSLAALTALTKLQASNCIMDLQLLVQLTGLQHLELHISRATLMHAADLLHGTAVEVLACTMGWMPRSSHSTVSQAFPALLQLTHLSLGGAYCHHAALAHISCLRSLQVLVLKPEVTEQGEGNRSTHQTAQQMAMAGILPKGEIFLCPSVLPGLSTLPHLLHITISGQVGFHPGVLLGLQQLQHLEAVSCMLPHCGEYPDGLAVLSQLSELWHLSLKGIRTYDRWGAKSLRVSECAALTASSHLTYLAFRDVEIPTNSSTSIFPAGKQLPELQVLIAHPNLLADPGAAMLLSSCCPALQALGIYEEDSYKDDDKEEYDSCAYYGIDTDDDSTGGYYYGPDCEVIHVSGLEQLNSLTELTLRPEGLRLDGPATFSVLTQLTGLQFLSVGTIVHAELVDAMQLTACKRLLKLELTKVCAHYRQCVLHLTSKAPFGSQPDVWRQLPQALMEQALHMNPIGIQTGLSRHREYDVQDCLSENSRQQLSLLLDLIDRHYEEASSNPAAAAAGPNSRERARARSMTEAVRKCLKWQELPSQDSLSKLLHGTCASDSDECYESSDSDV